MSNPIDNLYETQTTVDGYGADATLDYIISDSGLLTKFIDNDIQLLETYTISYLSNLQKIQLNNVNTIKGSGISNCNNLETILCPNLVNLTNTTGITNCPNLKTVDVGFISSLAQYNFLNYYLLETIILRKNNNIVQRGARQNLKSWPFIWGQAKFYVPSELLQTYKTNNEWVDLKNRIFSFEEYPVQTISDTISDSWSEIITKINNGTETYEVGDTKTMNVDGVDIRCKIIAKNADTITNTQNTATTTWVLYYPFEKVQWHTTSGLPRVFYENSNIRSYINSNIFPLLPSELKNEESGIKAVDKTSYYNDGEGNRYDTTSSEKLFLFSSRELGSMSCESTGPTYSLLKEECKLALLSNNIISNYSYWTRSYTYSDGYYINYISDIGNINSSNPNTAKNILLGFCI